MKITEGPRQSSQFGGLREANGSLSHDLDRTVETPNSIAEREDLRALRKREWTVLGFLLAVAVIAYFNVKRVVVDGISMQPTFKSAQSVLVWTSAPLSALKPGDIIVFHSPDGDQYIKRIVFIDNRTGTATPPTDVWTPDGPQPFEYIFEGLYRKGLKPTDDKRIWVMGDNFDHSEDSRDFGPIAPMSIIGKVIM